MITCLYCNVVIRDDQEGPKSICQDCVSKQLAELSPEELLTLAKVGLDAVIDEATGYENQRPRYDLRKRYGQYRRGNSGLTNGE